MKHGEKWIPTVTAILEILKINEIEEMEHLFNRGFASESKNPGRMIVMDCITNVF